MVDSTRAGRIAGLQSRLITELHALERELVVDGRPQDAAAIEDAARYVLAGLRAVGRVSQR